MSILEISNVSKSYASHKALDNVSISIPEASVFGLLGPNGAGKTSLIRTITQITAPDSGTITFKGEKLTPDHAMKMGYLPEERGLYKKMEVGEQALYLARLKGLSKADAIKKLKYWFEKFEIQAWWKKKVEELSKGMAQKVQFITTILHEPEFIILDEPFTGFDPINAELIKNELLELRNKGTTIVLSTHRMESVEELCNYIALINNSHVILQGAVKEIRKQYRTMTYDVTFHGTGIGFTQALWTGFELIDMKKEDDIQIARIKMLGNSTVNTLLQSILPYVEVLGVNEVIPSMNDIFINKVNESKASLSNSN
ncbi:MAG: ATP-binding cassette domain-containing protein [Bacteroidia bacterium]